MRLPRLFFASALAAGAAYGLWRVCTATPSEVDREAADDETQILLRRAVALAAVEEPDVPIEIRVLRADGSPAARATVFIEDPPAPPEAAGAFAAAHPLASLGARLAELGVARTTDSRGVVRARLPLISLFGLAAHDGGAWSAARLRREDYGPESTIELRLRPAPDLMVVACAPDGSPAAGVPLACEDSRAGIVHAIALTDEQGRAHFRALGEDSEAGWNPSVELRVSPAFPCGSEAVQSVGERHLAGEPLPMTLPPTGAVRVELQDAAGAPVADGTPVLLQTELRDGAPAEFLRPRASARCAHAESRGGIALFPRVGLGLALEFGADFQRGGNWEALRLAGPAAPGEEVRVLLRQRHPLPEIRARLIGARGAPLADLALEGRLIAVDARDSVRSHDFVVRTDGEGRCRVALPAAGWGASARRFLLMLLLRRGGVVLAAFGERAGEWRDNALDFGLLELGGPRLVGGSLRGPEGEPARTAYGAVLPPAGSPAEWRMALAAVQWLNGADSRFEIRGAFPPGDYRLAATASPLPAGWRPFTADFASGAAALDLRFPTRGELRGRLLVDASIPLDGIAWMLGEEDRVSGGPLAPRLADDGSFVLPLLEEGARVDFALYGAGDALPLLTVTRHPRETDGDALLGRLDLRGQLGVARFALPAARAGAPSVLLFPEATRARHGYVEVRAGEAVVFHHEHARCDALLPGLPPIAIELRDGVNRLP